MKTDISLPDAVFAEAEALAAQLGISRSELYAQALQTFLQRHKRTAQATDALNRAYAEEPSILDPALAKMQFTSLPREDW